MTPTLTLQNGYRQLFLCVLNKCHLLKEPFDKLFIVLILASTQLRTSMCKLCVVSVKN